MGRLFPQVRAVWLEQALGGGRREAGCAHPARETQKLLCVSHSRRKSGSFYLCVVHTLLIVFNVVDGLALDTEGLGVLFKHSARLSLGQPSLVRLMDRENALHTPIFAQYSSDPDPSTLRLGGSHTASIY
jgi:hypothetical protein